MVSANACRPQPVGACYANAGPKDANASPRKRGVFVMLPKTHRLTKGSDFKRVYATGKSMNGRRMRLKFVSNGLTYTRVGIVVANSVSKRATQRNKIKRMIRAATYSSLKQVRVGIDLVISAHSSATLATFEDIQKELAWLIDKAKLRT